MTRERAPGRLVTGIVALAAALSAGCAITNYQLITDNDQGRGPVNTHGKATCGKILVAVLWPDGNDCLYSFVDQSANGDRTLTTYDYYTPPGVSPFVDNLYCNPDWTGCSIFTAPDPEFGDVDPYDGKLNDNCPGARSLAFLLSTDRYYGECGRSHLSVDDRLALLNRGTPVRRFGREALRYELTSRDFRITLDNNAGDVSDLPISGGATAYVMPGRTFRVQLDATNPLLRNTGMAYASWLEKQATHATTVTASYHGIATTWHVAGNTGPSTPERIRQFVWSHE